MGQLGAPLDVNLERISTPVSLLGAFGLPLGSILVITSTFQEHPGGDPGKEYPLGGKG